MKEHVWRWRLASPVKTKHKTCKASAENERQPFLWYTAIRHSPPSGSHFAFCCHYPSWPQEEHFFSSTAQRSAKLPLLGFTQHLQSYFSLSFTKWTQKGSLQRIYRQHRYRQTYRLQVSYISLDQVSKLQPIGLMQLTACFCMASELRMDTCR